MMRVNVSIRLSLLRATVLTIREVKFQHVGALLGTLGHPDSSNIITTLVDLQKLELNPPRVAKKILAMGMLFNPWLRTRLR